MNMQKNSQSGFGVVEVLLILVIVGIVGFTGWRVYEANKEVSQTPTDNSKIETKKKETSAQNYLTYTNKEYKYKFDYPKSWKTSDAANEKGTAPGTPKRNSFTIESTDFSSSDEGVGYHVTSGASMNVRVSETSATDPIAYMQLPEQEFMNQVITDRQEMTVDGKKALRYKLHYEGSPSLHTLVVANGKVYTINFGYADDAGLAQYKAEYESLVKSFKVTE